MRFDELFEKMAGKGLVEDLGAAPDFDAFLAHEARKTEVPFNEARKAAEWIINRWPGRKEGT